MMAVTPLVLQPAKQAAQLGAQDGGVGQPGEERLDGVEHHALGADAVDRVPQPDEQPFQVVLARLLDLAALDVDEVEHQFLLRDQRLEIMPERGEVRRQLLGVLLEGHEDARLAELHRAAHEEFHGQQRLAAAGAAAQERRPPLGQAAAGEFIQSLDAGGRFGQRGAAAGFTGYILGFVVFHESCLRWRLSSTVKLSAIPACRLSAAGSEAPRPSAPRAPGCVFNFSPRAGGDLPNFPIHRPCASFSSRSPFQTAHIPEASPRALDWQTFSLLR